MGRRAIVFCVDVAHAMDVCEAFTAAGIRASAVWGDMPRDDRRIKLAQFSQGNIDVVTNCNVLTEGFDEPRVDAVIMARPTRSKLLYVQMVGRGTRLHPDKANLEVIDIADNFVSSQRPDSKKLVSRHASWRDRSPTEKQIEVLGRNGITAPPELTRGQASQMITYLLASPRNQAHRLQKPKAAHPGDSGIQST